MADYFTTRVKVPNIPKGQFSTVMRPFTALQAISNTGGKGLFNNFFNPKGLTAAEVAQSRYGFVDYPPFYDLEGNLKPARGRYTHLLIIWGRFLTLQRMGRYT